MDGEVTGGVETSSKIPRYPIPRLVGPEYTELLTEETNYKMVDHV